MPAIQLARLKIRISEILSFFNQPEEFLRELHELLEFYAERIKRPGQTGTPKPLIRAYNVPKQVMNRMKSDISSFVIEDPESALELADYLWEDNWFESRMLATSILGILPLTHPEIVVERLELWGESCREDVLIDVLLADGADRIREEAPNEYQHIVEEWLSSEKISSRKLGLRALPALVKNPNFNNLPVFYRRLAPLLRESNSVLETDLLIAVRALGRRSPQETAFFLMQNLTAPHKSGLEIITRRSLDVFPLDMQASLREILRKQMRIHADGNA